MSERVYTCEAEIGGRAVRIEYRAPERGVEPVRVSVACDSGSAHVEEKELLVAECIAIHEACERDWADRVEAAIDEQADAKLEERRDAELT